MTLTGTLCIVLALGLLMFFCFKGVPVILASIVSALLFALVTDPGGAYGLLTDSFMTSAANFFKSYFFVFLGGGLFGAMVEISGAADSIAEWVISRIGDRFICAGIMFAVMIMTFGGVSVFVALFAVYPFAMALFRRADIPRHLFIMAYASGGCTVTQNCAFSPAI